MTSPITDNLLERVGSFGRYQIRLLLIINFAMMFCAMTLIVMTFSTAEPPWKCVSNSNVCTLNGTFKVGDKSYDHRCNIERSHWQFDINGSFDSIVTEWDLVCNKAVYVSVVNSLTFVVWIIGAMIASISSDKFGRKKLTFAYVVIVCVSGFASAFTQVYWAFAIFRSLVGFGIGGFYTCSFVLLLETTGLRHRNRAGILIWAGVMVGFCLLCLIAWKIPNWRTLSYITSAPGLLFVLFWWWTPESLRWLLSKGKLDEAKNTLKDIAKINGRQLPDNDMVCLDTREEQEKTERLGDVRDLFASRTLTHRTLVLSYGWMVCGMQYYGISLSAPTIGGNMYLNFFITVVSETLSLVVSIPVLNRFGRTSTVVVHLILGSVALMSAALVSYYDDGSNGFLAGKIITSMVLGKLFTLVAFNVVYIHSTELFPTVVRNTGMGILTSAARVGAAASPYIVYTQRTHSLLPFGIMAILGLVGGILYITLPETKNVAMPDTVKQVTGKQADNKSDTLPDENSMDTQDTQL